MTYYEILEVTENASDEVIRMAYKALVKKYHPDVYSGDAKYAEEQIKKINEAYDVLSNQTTRYEYDQQLKTDYRSEDNRKAENCQYEEYSKNGNAYQGMRYERGEYSQKKSDEVPFLFQWKFVFIAFLCTILFGSKILFFISAGLMVIRFWLSQNNEKIQLVGKEKLAAVVFCGLALIGSLSVFSPEVENVDLGNESSVNAFTEVSSNMNGTGMLNGLTPIAMRTPTPMITDFTDESTTGLEQVNGIEGTESVSPTVMIGPTSGVDKPQPTVSDIMPEVKEQQGDIPTSGPSVTPTSTPIPSVTSTPTPTSTPIPTVTPTPTVMPIVHVADMELDTTYIEGLEYIKGYEFSEKEMEFEYREYLRCELKSIGTELTVKQVQINAKIYPENATDKSIVWTSTDPSVATVDENGLVTIVGSGSCTICAQSSTSWVYRYCNVYVEYDEQDYEFDVIGGDVLIYSTAYEKNQRIQLRIENYLEGDGEIRCRFQDKYSGKDYISTLKLTLQEKEES